MKQKIFVASLLICIALFGATALVLGHEDGAMDDEEETGISHQFEELNPFVHFGEGHAAAGIILIILWASFLYVIYSFIFGGKAQAKKRR